MNYDDEQSTGRRESAVLQHIHPKWGDYDLPGVYGERPAVLSGRKMYGETYKTVGSALGVYSVTLKAVTACPKRMGEPFGALLSFCRCGYSVFPASR